MHASLSSLPVELLVTILNYITSQPHRWALVTASKHFYSSLVEEFYKHIALGQALTPVLVKELLQRPERARAVRSLQLTISRLRNADRRYYETTPNRTNSMTFHPTRMPLPEESDINQVFGTVQADQEFIEQEKKDFKFHVEECNIRNPDVGNIPSDIWAGLVLLLTPNITFLDIILNHGHYYPKALIQRLATRLPDTPMLNSLTHISLRTHDSEYSMNVQEIEYLFDFPSLRSISAYSLRENAVDEGSREQDSEPPPKASNVTQLDLSESNGMNGMSGLIKHCPKLESFIFDHSHVWVSDGELKIDTFARSLRPVSKTLKTLQIDYGEDGMSVYEFEKEFDRPFGSFTLFEELQHLHMRLCNLVGTNFNSNTLDGDLVSILPFKLESLYISMVDREFLPPLFILLEAVIDKRKEHTPSLRRIDIEDSMGSFLIPEPPPAGMIYVIVAPAKPRFIDPDVYKMMQPLVDKAAAAGVALHIRCSQDQQSMKGLGYPRHSRHMVGLE